MANVTYNDHTTDTSLIDTDLIPFWDVTAGAAKKATRANLLANAPEIVTARSDYDSLTERIDDLSLTDVFYVDAAFTGSAATNRYTTIGAAITACAGGETIVIAPGTYTENVSIGANHVKLIGSGMPIFDGGTGRLVGGTIVRGTINCNSRPGIEVHNLGVDAVGLSSNGITASSISTSTRLEQVFTDLVLVGDGYDAADHAIESNGGAYVHFNNIRMYYWYHGLAILGQYITASNIYAYACAGTSIIVKSKTGSGDCKFVNISNVVTGGLLGGTLKTQGGAIVLEGVNSGYTTSYINVSNVTATNTNIGAVRLNATGDGAISNVTFVNVSSRTTQGLTTEGDFNVARGDNIKFIGCHSGSRAAGYGFLQTSPATNVYLIGCSGDGSASGDSTGTFKRKEINGIDLAGRELATATAYRHSALWGAVSNGSVSVTGANTPVASLSSPNGVTAGGYSGIVLVHARDGTTSAGAQASYALLVFSGSYSGGTGIVTSLGTAGLVNGAGAAYPSFTFTVDATNNHLEATPVGSTSGTFYFSFTSIGSIAITAI